MIDAFFNINFYKGISGSDSINTYNSFTFNVPYGGHTFSLNYTVDIMTSQGAKSDGWCWTLLYINLDGVDIASRTLYKSNGGTYALNLYTGNVALAAGNHTITFRGQQHASSGDGNAFAVYYNRILITDIAGGNSYTPTSWTDPTITANTTDVRAVHFNELRNAINNMSNYSAALNCNTGNCSINCCQSCQACETCQSCETAAPANCGANNCDYSGG